MKALAFGLALCCSLVAAASAQPFNLDTAKDSPMWWPLADEITASELRAAYLEPGGHQKRYLEAVDAGLEAKVPKSRLADLDFYVNWRLNPELRTMQNVFLSLSKVWGFVLSDAEIAQGLAERGVTSSGIKVILAAANELDQRSSALAAELAPDSDAFIRLQWEILERLGKTEALEAQMDEAIKLQDVGFFVANSGKDPTEIKQLLSVATRDPLAEPSVDVLLRLKEGLTAADWQALQRYLRQEAAVRSDESFLDW